MGNYHPVPRLPERPPRVRVFWTRNNCLGKKQQQLLLSESISESFSWNRSLLNPFLEKCWFCLSNLKFVEEAWAWFPFPMACNFNAEVVACCRNFCLLSLSKDWWSDTPWAKPGEYGPIYIGSPYSLTSLGGRAWKALIHPPFTLPPFPLVWTRLALPREPLSFKSDDSVCTERMATPEASILYRQNACK